MSKKYTVMEWHPKSATLTVMAVRKTELAALREANRRNIAHINQHVQPELIFTVDQDI